MQPRADFSNFVPSPDQVAAFQSDGYLIVRALFSEEETAYIRQTMEQDPIVQASGFDRTDESGAATRAVDNADVVRRCEDPIVSDFLNRRPPETVHDAERLKRFIEDL